MKRHITILVLMMLVLSMIIPVFAADATANTTIDIDHSIGFESSSPELNIASKETLEIAKDAVEQLEKEIVFSLGLECSLDHMYNTAKWVVPDVAVLETKKDASLALIEVYEEILTAASNYDFDNYNAFWKKAMANALDNPAELSDYIRYGRKILGERETIEALLALDCYHDLLDGYQLQRMSRDFNEFANIVSDSSKQYYSDAESYTVFELYRSAREGSKDAIKGTCSVGFTLNGISYVNNSTVNTTSGTQITTFYAQSQLLNPQISAFYYNFYGQSGFSDLTYVSTATSYYNCHAYAWYNTTPGEKWIANTATVNNVTYNGVESFINDSHSTYLGSSDSVAQVNDIIVYYVNGNPAHSGIVISTNPLRIRSKWGQGCVWEHNKTTVPSEYKETSGTVNVKYYRYTRNHSLQYIDYGNETYHKHQCSVCGNYTLEPHHWVEYHVHPSKDNNGIRYIPEYHCSDCGAMTLFPPA